jgi:16S rRNA (cytosine967-C5)-methyltransferase
VCQTSITTEGLEQIFANNGISCVRGRLVDSCLQINDRGSHKGPLEKIPGYAEGLFTVQDEAAALVSKIVAPQPGDLVVDLCAAPGGKSLHLGELMDNRGRIIAVDNKASRLSLLRKSRQRLGLTNIEIKETDGRSLQLEAPADKILIDAPLLSRATSGIQHRELAPVHQRVFAKPMASTRS